jgi:GNAT superfamily N-acetyltransferase
MTMHLPQPIAVDRADGSSGVREDAWLSERFGHAVFAVEVPAGAQGGALAELTADLDRHAAAQRRAFYYAKVDAGRVEQIRALQAAGFFVVEANVTLGMEASSRGRPADPVSLSGCVVRSIEPRDTGEMQAVLDIAGRCFRYSRFHLDHEIEAATADRIKRDWVVSYVRGQRGDALAVAVGAGRPVGFLAALASERDGRRVRLIDLMAVDEPFQGRGIGRQLVGDFLQRYQPACDILEVGTQLANAPSIRLYERAGFSLRRAAYVLHRHARAG